MPLSRRKALEAAAQLDADPEPDEARYDALDTAGVEEPSPVEKS
jgi:hypothetical protein